MSTAPATFSRILKVRGSRGFRGTVAPRRDQLAQRRKALGLTQEDLAALLEVERSTVVRWESGATAPARWLRLRLARTLKLSPDRIDELLADPEPAPPGEAPATVPRQLPAAVPHFTGRAAELRALHRILDEAVAAEAVPAEAVPGEAGAAAPGTVVISAIGGAAGVGKTALALYWAHRVASRFPDGQLHVNLRGFDPSGNPVTPQEAIRGFLHALGVPPGQMPPDQDAQADLYRTLLSGKRMLIVLDNARDEQQVRQLLLASRASMVLVTSRNRLSGLAADGARTLFLDVLPPGEAAQLLTARLGPDRTAAEPAAVAEIADLCAYLPLALAVAAARAATRPGLPLSALAAELRDNAGRLDALDTGDPAASVRTVFSWSYDQLTPESARMFRLLGLHPGPDITGPAAASLAATSETEARRQLRELTRACVIAEHQSGRYAFHDLLRTHAAELARSTDSETDRGTAVARLLDHYLGTASAAALAVYPYRVPMDLVLSPGVLPESFATDQQAMAWFEAERHVLFAASALAAQSGFDRHAWQLPWAMVDYLERSGHFHARISILNTAVAATIRLGDTAAQSSCRRGLGHAYYRLGDYAQAVLHLQRSLELSQQAGDDRGVARSHVVLGYVAEDEGRYADGIGHFERALELYRAVGHTAGEAQLLNSIGYLHGLLGDFQQTRTFCQRSLELTTKLGYRHNEGYVLDSLGYAEHHLGNNAAAAAWYERAVTVFREFGGRFDEASTLTHLGDTRLAAGDLPRARAAWQQALSILEDLRHSDAEKVRAKLADL